MRRIRHCAALLTVLLLAACGRQESQVAAATTYTSPAAGIRPPEEMPALSSAVLADLAAGDPKLMALLPNLEIGERAAIRHVMDDARSKLTQAATVPVATTWRAPPFTPLRVPVSQRSFGTSLLDFLIAPAGAAEYVGIQAVQAIAVGYVFTNFMGAAADQGPGEPGKEMMRSEFAEKSGEKASIVVTTEKDGQVTAELDTQIAVGLFLIDANSKVSITSRGLCPDGNGKVEFTLKYSSGGHRGGGRNMAYDRTREAHVTATVNDDAEIADADIDTQYGDRATTDGRQTYAGASTSWTAVGGDIGKLRVISHGNERLSSEATDADRQRMNDAATHAMAMGQAALQGARSHWQNGACIRIVAASPGRVKRKAESKIPVKVIHRLDSSDVAAKVKVELTGGETVSPALIPRTPATLTHTAPDAKVAKMSIELIARSKRGMARETLKLLVNEGVYDAEGGAGDFHGEGRICNLAEPFEISGSGVTVKFAPSSEQGGTYTYDGSIAGFHLYGQGTYKVISDDAGPKEIFATGPGNVDDASGAGDEHYKLTPTEDYRCDNALN